jgi:XTP/dITP diphosphohydrolase
MKPILLATANAHKTEEFRALLGSDWQVLDLRDFPQLISPEETGSSFEENAKIKAESASSSLPDLLVLADDSGLSVDTLNGQPGVHSARYAGPNATDTDNRAHLLSQLRSHAPHQPQHPARFHCCIAIAKNGQTLSTHHGTVEGHIITTEQGTGGFGYDPLFIPQGHEQTFGQLPGSIKNQLSHRSRALSQAHSWLQTR